jgi:hypothetical protein
MGAALVRSRTPLDTSRSLYSPRTGHLPLFHGIVVAHFKLLNRQIFADFLVHQKLDAL